MQLKDLKDRRVLLAGLGREGLATLQALRHHLPAEIAVCDQNPDVAGQLPEWARSKVRVFPDPTMLAASDYEIIIKSPGVPPHVPGIVQAVENGCILTSSTRLWFDEAKGHTVIGVTGTKGKSTTATLVHRFLESAGNTTYLLGNIGLAALSVLPQDVDKDAVFVLELSSFQLWDLDISPGIAVLLNVYEDHIDWHGSREAYLRAKMNLMKHQSTGDVLVFHGKTPGFVEMDLPGKAKRKPYCTGDAIHHDADWFYKGNQKLFKTGGFTLHGLHNRDNACAALSVMDSLGYEPETFQQALYSFQGLPHRLETIATISGVQYVDDSIATGPDAAIHAMNAFPGMNKIILMGGKDKGVGLEELVERLCQGDVQAVILTGRVGERIRDLLQKRSQSTPEVHWSDDLSESVTLSRELSTVGSVVLLAPGAASAPPFRDFIERGNYFRKCVLALA